MVESRAVASLPSSAVIPLLSVGGLTLAGSVWAALRGWRTARLLASTPPTAISALTPGLHEVRGAIRGEGSLRSPLSDRPCVYWRFLVEQRRQNAWEVLVDAKDAVDVVLDDGGGRMVLQPRLADVVLSRPEHTNSGILGVPSAELTAVLARLGEAPTGLQGPFVRYREELLADGDRLHVVGTVVQGGDDTWELGAGDVHVLSDREEAEVVRHEERMALRWVGVAVVGLALVAFAVSEWWGATA